MVNFLVVMLFCIIFSVEFLVKTLEVLPWYFALLPELMSAFAMLVVIGRAISTKSLAVGPRYLLFYGILTIIFLAAIVLQSVPLGAIINGLRDYFRYLPFFLLPIVYPFTERQLKIQFGVLLGLLFIQPGLAAYQRFVQYAHAMHTGDPVTGTLTTSSALSIVMICGVAAVVTLYLRRFIRLPMALALIGLFFFPTTINETKATIFLFAVALVVPMFAMPKGRRSLRRMVPVFAIGAVGAIVFVQTYDHFAGYRDSRSTLGSFFTDGTVQRYLYSGAADGEFRAPGRVDSVVMATKVLSQDPFAMAFGLGAGNVTESPLPGFSGDYSHYYKPYAVGMTQLTQFLWEIGVVGLATYLMLYWFVFRDSLYVSRRATGAFGVLGHSWAAFIMIMTPALAYKTVLTMNEIGYLFWFYSGMVAAHARLLRREARAAAFQSRKRASDERRARNLREPQPAT